MPIRETPEEAGLELIRKISDTEYIFKDLFDELGKYELWVEGGTASYNIIYNGLNLEFVRSLNAEELDEIENN